MSRLAALLGLAGLAVATVLFARAGFTTVFAALATAGIGVVWASLFHFVSMALNGRAWQVLLGRGRGRSVAFFTWLVWVRESVNGLLPVARVGGEIATARLLVRRGVRSAPAVASLVVDMSVSLGTQLVFTLGGVALLVERHGTGPLLRNVTLALVLAVPVIALLVLVQRVGMFELLGRIVRALSADRFEGIVGSARRFDRAVHAVYRRRGRLLRCAGWQLAGWAAGAGEIWLALSFLGSPIPVLDALMIEALVQASSSAAFVVPAAVGVQEGVFLAVGSVAGLGPETALALALARRARDVIVFVPALLIWQGQEGRSLFTARG